MRLIASLCCTFGRMISKCNCQRETLVSHIDHHEADHFCFLFFLGGEVFFGRGGGGFTSVSLFYGEISFRFI